MQPYLQPTLKAAIAAGCSQEFAQRLAEENVVFDRLIVFKLWAHFYLCGAYLLSELFLFLACLLNSKRLLG
jgi:hypothetical protein